MGLPTTSRIAGFALALTLLSLVVPAAATAQQGGGQSGYWVYMVPYECGYQRSIYGLEGYEPPVKMGNYATKIDVLNPTEGDLELTGTVLGEVRWPGPGAGQANTPPQILPAATMAAGNSKTIECADIAQATHFPLPNLSLNFITGVLTIRSSTPIAVWVTKTTQICSGLVAKPIEGVGLRHGPDGEIFSSTGMSLGAPIPAVFSCPSVESVPGDPTPLQPGGYGIPGVVVPGIRPPGMIVPIGGSQGVVMDVSVAHTLDTEQVEGVFVATP